MPNTTSPSQRRAVILTALPVEFVAVRDHIADIQESVHPKGTVYHVGQLREGNVHWEVVLVELGAGNSPAAVEAERAIQFFQPEVVLFLGVAGGLKDVRLGDVVAATKVYGYDSGKAANAFQPRPDTGLPNYALVQRARAVASGGRWTQRILGPSPGTEPAVHIAPIAAGEQVVASKRSPTYKLIRETYGDAVAVEMESRGFLQAAYSNSDVRALVVRGISDLVSNKRSADAAGFQETASRHAAAFAVELLLSYAAAIPSTATPLAPDANGGVGSAGEAGKGAPTRTKGLEDSDPWSTYAIRLASRLTDERDWYVEVGASSPLASRVPRAEFGLVPLAAGEDAPQFPLTQWLVRARRGLLVGSLGSGKSTALARVVPELQAAGRIPILAPLRDSNEAGVLDLLRRVVGRERVLVTRDDLEQGLRSAHCTVLLDGLNEIPSDVRETVLADIRRFVTDFPDTPVVLTSREGEAPQFDGFETTHIQPLSLEQRSEFAKVYLGEERAKQFIGRLFRRQPLVTELAGRPLFLKMLLEVYDATGNIPPNAGELLRRFFAHVLGEREGARGATYREPELTAILGPVALEMLSRGRLWLTYDELAQSLDRTCAELLARPTYFSLRAALERHPIRSELESRSLLLFDDGKARFPHPAIGDYFAARGLAETFAADSTLAVPAHDASYVQALLFLADLLAGIPDKLHALMDLALPHSQEVFCHAAALLSAAANLEQSTSQMGWDEWGAALLAAYARDGGVLRERWAIPVPPADEMRMFTSTSGTVVAHLLHRDPSNAGQLRFVGSVGVNRQEMLLWPPRVAALQVLAAHARRARREPGDAKGRSLAEFGWETHLGLIEHALSSAKRD